MKSDEKLLTELTQATDGLLFMSESDYPFEPVRWPDQTELTPDAVRRLTGSDESAPIETQSVNDFFRPAATEADWKNAQQLAAARRYQALVGWLQDNLADVRVYRIGHCVERLGDGADLLLGFRPVALFNRFAHGGQGLDTVACVIAGRVNLISEPSATRQAVRAQHRALGLLQRFVERRLRLWR